jgi:hypothetical protein
MIKWSFQILIVCTKFDIYLLFDWNVSFLCNNMLIVAYFIRLIPEHTNEDKKDNRPVIIDTSWDAGKTTVV